MKPQQIETTLVAVYGTLRRDFGNHARLIRPALVRGEADDLGNGKADGWRMYSWGGFPAICEGNSDETIVVEVYRVDAATLRNLDRLEGYDATRGDTGFYDRRSTLVVLDGGETVEALIYCMPPDRAAANGPWIESGDFLAFEQSRTRDFRRWA